MTFERLQIDRILGEAHASTRSASPPVFGPSEDTIIRSDTAAHELLEFSAERDAAGGSPEPNDHPCR